MIGEAMAMAAGQGGAAQSGGGAMGMLIPLILMFIVMYLLILRPQQKRMRQHQQMLASLKQGDEVVTSGGIYGRVTGIADKAVTLEIANNVRIKVAKGHIAGKKDEVTNTPSCACG